jgi:hypothetical protein
LSLANFVTDCTYSGGASAMTYFTPGTPLSPPSFPSIPPPVSDPIKVSAPVAPGGTFDLPGTLFTQPVLFTFPAGRIATFVVGATPGNIVFELAPPAGKRWQFLRGRLQVVCDATVADRLLRLAVYSNYSAVHLGPIFYGDIAVALATRSIAFKQWWTGAGNFAESEDTRHFIGNDVLLDEDHFIRLWVSNGVVGDLYSGILEFLEVRA